jgi:hypothetical protein
MARTNVRAFALHAGTTFGIDPACVEDRLFAYVIDAWEKRLVTAIHVLVAAAWRERAAVLIAGRVTRARACADGERAGRRAVACAANERLARADASFIGYAGQSIEANFTGKRWTRTSFRRTIVDGNGVERTNPGAVLAHGRLEEVRAAAMHARP